MHFLNKGELVGRHLPKPRAGAKAKLQGRNTLMLCTPDDDVGGPCIFVLKPDVPLCKLPERVKVVDSAGSPVKPSSGYAFYVTRETFNPYHGLVEVPEGEI